MAGTRRGNPRIAYFAAVLAAVGEMAFAHVACSAAAASLPRAADQVGSRDSAQTAGPVLAASFRATSAKRGLLAVAAASPASVWAVGTLIEHWDGRRWSIKASPRTPGCTPFLLGVTVVSRSDVWAAGKCVDVGRLSAAALIEHWNGRRWTVTFNRQVGSGTYSELLGITAASATSLWAVGDYEASTGTASLVEHWNGRKWTIQPSPNPSANPAVLDAVTAVSQTNAWAVGYYDTAVPPVTSMTLVEHWNGQKWSVQHSFSPGNGGNQLNSAIALSATNVWAAGNYGYTSGSVTGSSTLIEHWDGRTWSVQSTGNPGTSNAFYGVAGSSSSNAWAVGSFLSGTTISTLTEHWNGRTWAIKPSPSPGTAQDQKGLLGVTLISPSDAWTVGFYDDEHTIVEHWNGSAWRLHASP